MVQEEGRGTRPSLLCANDREHYCGGADGWPASPAPAPPPFMCDARRSCIFCWSASNFCFCSSVSTASIFWLLASWVLFILAILSSREDVVSERMDCICCCSS